MFVWVSMVTSGTKDTKGCWPDRQSRLFHQKP